MQVMADSVGQILSEAREECGLTTMDLAKITRIPHGSIIALEEGNFDSLPAPVFVRGFIRAYCREVDVDPTEVLEQYDAHLHETQLSLDEEGPSNLGPLLFVGSDVPAQPSHRGLQISHVLLLLLALATFIIAYVTAGLPSSNAADTAQVDQASTEQTTTTTATGR